MMFKEGKATPASGRFSSPLVRRRLPHTVYMSPQTPRKNSGRGFSRMKKKSSVPEGLIPTSPSTVSNCGDLAFNAFCEDPKNMQINEHVSYHYCISISLIICKLSHCQQASKALTMSCLYVLSQQLFDCYHLFLFFVAVRYLGVHRARIQ